MAAMLNAMTVDVEDYFHVSAFADLVSPASWPSFESRVCANTEKLLHLFEKNGVRATFFVLGWVAERYPQLVRRIHEDGHEIASHSYDHGLVYERTPESFRLDLQRARVAIEQACGVQVRGYRAPSYSVTERSLWAVEVLVSEGYEYDSSIYPIRHDRYGIPHWDRHIHQIQSAEGALWELPGSTVCHMGINLPIGGGGYFRLLPYWWTRYGIQTLNDVERRPAIFYLHPWEVDPGQPRLNGRLMSRFRHYHNLGVTETRLRRLLKDFRFGTVSEVLAEVERAPETSRQAVMLETAIGRRQIPQFR
ncbi:MAG TPA: XrtA system polysaccharide deacetylase [Vicinamibacterales bacterium]|nr:XrtA system polysaccharide deacetylase [Vicinamibacterales bacterium]